LTETIRVVPALEFTSVPRTHTTSIYRSPEADRFMVGSTGAAGPRARPRARDVLWWIRGGDGRGE